MSKKLLICISSLVLVTTGMTAIEAFGYPNATPNDPSNHEARCLAFLGDYNGHEGYGDFSVDTTIPNPSNYYFDYNTQIYNYLAAHSAAGRYLQIGTVVRGKYPPGQPPSSIGEYFYGWKDANNYYTYIAFDTIKSSEYGRPANYTCWSYNNGTWGAQINTTSRVYASPTTRVGDSSAVTTLVALETTNCDTSSYPPFNFSNAWYRYDHVNPSSWLQWPICINDGTPPGKAACPTLTYHHTGTLQGGGSVSMWIN